MRIVFFGTPAFAVPSLERLLQGPHSVAAVVTQPERPQGRSRKSRPTPVQALAQSRRIPILQPLEPASPDLLRRLERFRCPAAAVVAYGALLPQPLLDRFRLGAANLHASLLPKLRGAAPIPWALIRGETKTGVTIFRLDEQLDHGPILMQRECAIQPDDDAVSLSRRLAPLGADLLQEALTRLEDGTAQSVPQDDTLATTAPRLKKEDGILNWAQDCQSLHNLVRGVQPWPGAVTELSGALLKLHRTTPDPHRHDPAAAPGTVVEAHPAQGLWVQTGQGQLRIDLLQPAGGRVMTAAEFLRGHRIRPGEQRLLSPA